VAALAGEKLQPIRISTIANMRVFIVRA